MDNINTRSFLILNADAGLPWWLSGKQSACQHRRHGFDPLSGRSHMLRGDQVRAPQLVSLWSGPRKPQPEKSPHTTAREEPAHTAREEPAHHNERGSPHSTTREGARTHSQRRAHTPQLEREPAQHNERGSPHTTTREDACRPQLERTPGHHSQRGSPGTTNREEKPGHHS